MPDFKARLARIQKNASSDGEAGDSMPANKDTADTTFVEQESKAREHEGQQAAFRKKLERLKAHRSKIEQVRHGPSSAEPDTEGNEADATNASLRTDLAGNQGSDGSELRHEPMSWRRVGEYLETRTLVIAIEENSEIISGNWPALVPQCRQYLETHGNMSKANLLFFDLETTGLSGGAGTLAFLAAFGCFDGARLCVRQYLLLDYAGENEFLEAVDAELYDTSPDTEKASDSPRILVTYNGRAYDTQILRNRFLLAGMRRDLAFTHLDLLYPARLLWKHRLRSCSQKDIEREVLGMERGFDLPGSEAPYAWFSFLRTGSRERLEMIADHNARDIHGLASLFLAMNRVAENPLEAGLKYQCDLRNLGHRWRHDRLQQRLLLNRAVETQAPEALWDIAMSCIEDGDNDEAEVALAMLADREDVSSMQKYEAYRKLAVRAEWKRKDYPRALDWTNKALELKFLTQDARKDLQKRKNRLEARRREP